MSIGYLDFAGFCLFLITCVRILGMGSSKEMSKSERKEVLEALQGYKCEPLMEVFLWISPLHGAFLSLFYGFFLWVSYSYFTKVVLSLVEIFK